MGCPCNCCSAKLGACCTESGCTQETCSDCKALGGLWQGPDTECVDDACPCDPPADDDLCEKCDGGTPVWRCPDWQVCRDGKCVFCENEPGDRECPGPDYWRIADSDGNVYDTGPIVNGSLEGLPNPWRPEFYYTTEPWEVFLEADCGGWHELESWVVDIELCGTESERYPTQPLDGPWPPPPGCDCVRCASTGTVIDPCIPCPDLSPGSYEPPTNVGVTFTGAVDGEWTNLANWEDGSGASPAGLLPGSADAVTIQGSVRSSAVGISVGDMTITGGGECHVEASAQNLY